MMFGGNISAQAVLDGARESASGGGGSGAEVRRRGGDPESVSPAKSARACVGIWDQDAENRQDLIGTRGSSERHRSNRDEKKHVVV
jgi:hypothetical protein